jgi:hypothetical protein
LEKINIHTSQTQTQLKDDDFNLKYYEDLRKKDKEQLKVHYEQQLKDIIHLNKADQVNKEKIWKQEK